MISTAALPKLPSITQISSRIIRVLGANPSPYTLQGTNSYIVGHGRERWLIDTTNPGMTEYLKNLREVIQQNKMIISNILITHWHEDHIGAVPEVQKLCEELTGISPKAHKFPGEISRVSIEIADIASLHDNQKIRVDDQTTLRVLYTPGHTKDHVTVVLEEENVLFAGDIILGHGSAVFETLSEYMNSLKRLQSLSPPWSRILSAHGADIEEADATIALYISHREARINQVAASLKDQGSLTPEEILDKVYPGLSDSLKIGALNNITHALDYLKDNGKAIQNESGAWMTLGDCKL